MDDALREKVREWRDKRYDFVLLKYPQSETITAVLISSVEMAKTVNELKGVNAAFVFAPFSIDHHPIKIFHSKVIQSFEFRKHEKNRINDDVLHPSTPDKDYRLLFRNYVSELNKGEAEKLVLARKKEICSDVDFLDLFLDACSEYPDSMVYLLQSADTGIRLGASPELLVEGNTTQMHTVALAGTMRCDNDRPVAFSEWSEKNKQEQALVADYIRNCIRNVAMPKDEWGPYICKTGNLAHIKTDFYFILSTDKLAEFLVELPPTPAVCGVPKEKAIKFINTQEADGRGYYSGFFGWYEPRKTTRLYVNLRCLHAESPSRVQLFAGGGILQSSDLESEWMETELKMQTLLSLPSFQKQI